MTTETQAFCPYCGEEISLIIDCSVDDQVYTEDCPVCCKPILVHLVASDLELISIELNREDD